MPKRIFAYFVRFVAVSLVLVGGFFYTQGIQVVEAQTQASDLALDSVSLLGDIAVIYRNDGAPISSQSYAVSFQWVDAAGTGLSPKQTLKRNALVAQGRDILPWNTTIVEGTVMAREQRCYTTGSFLRRRTKCDYIQVPRTITQPLAAYRAARPRSDALLAVVLDDGNRIAEIDEGNNSARVGDTPFRGASPVLPAELVVTRATFDGVFLFVVFQNQSSVSIVNRPFDVGLQWLDKAGSPLGDRRFLRYKNLASGKVEVIDSKIPLFTLAQTGSGLDDTKTAEPLPMYLIRRPVNAAKLRVTVDDRNQISEVNKTNNVVIIELPTPDLLILDQKLTAQGLSFKYVNGGAAPLIGSSPLSFWFEWVDAKGTRVSDQLYWFNRDAGSLRQNVPVAFTSNGIAVYSSRGMFMLNQILQNPPAEAAALKVTIDGPNVFTELTEINNSVVLQKPVVPLPDLTITKQVQILNPQRLAFSYINASKVPLTQSPSFSFWFEWVDEKGARIGDNLYWQDRGASLALPGVTNIFNSAGVYVYAYRGAFASLDSLLRNPPEKATHLKVTIDGTNKIRETDENNNSALFPLAKPEASKLPDLGLTAVTRAGGVVRVTIANGTPDMLRAPLLQFKWLDAKDVSLGTSPVSYWTGANIASGKTGEFAIEYEKWREDGVTYFLKHPPAGTVALLTTIDPENKLKESNEDNNSFRLAISGQPDLAYGTPVVRSGALIIPVTNQGGLASAATDIWLQWYGGGKWLPSTGAVDVPAIAPGAITEISVPLDRSFGADGKILADIPSAAERLRLFLDGSRKVDELNEQNNTIMLERAVFPKIIEATTLPDLAFNAIHMAGNKFFVVSMKNVGTAPVSEFVWQMRWLDRAGKIVGETYQNIHAGLKPNWNIGVTSDAQDKTGKPMTMGEFVSLPPEGAVLLEALLDPDNRIAELNEQNNRAIIAALALEPLKKELPKLKPEVIQEKPDLTVDGAGFLPLVDIIEKDRAPFEAVFSAIVSNKGKQESGAFRARVRVDNGGNGTWEAVSPSLVSVPTLAVGAQTLIKLPLEWKAAVGTYTFEICVDPGNNVAELDEKNNCATDRFTLAVGEEPAQEEEGIEE